MDGAGKKFIFMSQLLMTAPDVIGGSRGEQSILFLIVISPSLCGGSSWMQGVGCGHFICTIDGMDINTELQYQYLYHHTVQYCTCNLSVQVLVPFINRSCGEILEFSPNQKAAPTQLFLCHTFSCALTNLTRSRLEAPVVSRLVTCSL